MAVRSSGSSSSGSGIEPPRGASAAVAEGGRGERVLLLKEEKR
jgi:hypothetical protein